jgi:hypothetical protein
MFHLQHEYRENRNNFCPVISVFLAFTKRAGLHKKAGFLSRLYILNTGNMNRRPCFPVVSLKANLLTKPRYESYIVLGNEECIHNINRIITIGICQRHIKS